MMVGGLNWFLIIIVRFHIKLLTFLNLISSLAHPLLQYFGSSFVILFKCIIMRGFGNISWWCHYHVWGLRYLTFMSCWIKWWCGLKVGNGKLFSLWVKQPCWSPYCQSYCYTIIFPIYVPPLVLWQIKKIFGNFFMGAWVFSSRVALVHGIWYVSLPLVGLWYLVSSV